MTARTLTLETAEERALWVQAHAAAQAQGPLHRAPEIADNAVRAYRERCEASPLSDEPDDTCPGCGVFNGEFCHDECDHGSGAPTGPGWAEVWLDGGWRDVWVFEDRDPDGGQVLYWLNSKTDDNEHLTGHRWSDGFARGLCHDCA